MKKALILTSIFTALTSVAALAENGAGQDTDCSYLNHPIRVLNGETGRYDTLRTNTDRGWCKWSNGTISDGTWDADGGDRGESGNSDSSSGSEGGEGPY
jgi:hypothetical protein